MKQLFLPFIFLFLASGVSAQVPGVFSFQGVAKNANGQPLAAGTSIKVRFTVHDGSPGGFVALTDTHSPTVSQGGIFNVFMGNGNLTGTSIDALNWGNKEYYLQVELAADGINYSDMGTTQFVSVPYALHSNTANSAKEARRWQQSISVVQTGIFGDGGSLGSIGGGPRLIWYPKKAAFRAGENFNNAWEDANIGEYSFAGNRATASGSRSTAFGESIASGTFSFGTGFQSEAGGNYSVAGGSLVKAYGDYAIALGNDTEATGNSSVALGKSTFAKAYGSTTIGAYNNVQDNAVGTVQGATAADRIFQIGNGTGALALSNALTVLRNGNVGIGNNVLAPTHILEVGGRARMRHNVASAGLYFDNSQNSPVGFVGMQNDNVVGFYIGNKWVLEAAQSEINVRGNLNVFGELWDSSDRRLKKDFSKLNNSSTKLNSLQGYHYYWKDTTKSQSLQTGLIAQEVEALFPELVKTDEKGMKSVNYVGLIPHLIEAVKEQNKQIVTLKERLDKVQH